MAMSLRKPGRAGGWAVGAALVLAAAGCGGKHTPVPVRGVVTLDGKPVEGATVHFYAEGEDREGRLAYGSTDAEGVFRLSTLGREDGALPRAYKVVVIKYVPLRPNVKIPDFPKTAQGKADLEDFKYKIYGDGPRTKNALPARYADINTTPFHVTVPARGDVALELTSK
jgi:hypothetical protein